MGSGRPPQVASATSLRLARPKGEIKHKRKKKFKFNNFSLQIYFSLLLQVLKDIIFFLINERIQARLALEIEKKKNFFFKDFCYVWFTKMQGKKKYKGKVERKKK